MIDFEREFQAALQKISKLEQRQTAKFASLVKESKKKKDDKEGAATDAQHELEVFEEILATLGRLGADVKHVIKSRGKDGEFASKEVKRAERALNDVKRDVKYIKQEFPKVEHYLSKI